MLRYIVFVISFISIVWGHEHHKHCHKLFKEGGVACCKDEFKEKPASKDPTIIKECAQLASKPSCEQEICMANKFGIASADGTIDKPKITALIEKDADGYPEIIAAVKEKCIDGDLSHYGRKDMCELIKWEHCMTIQAVGHCSKWDDEGSCKGMREVAAKCLENYP